MSAEPRVEAPGPGAGAPADGQGLLALAQWCVLRAVYRHDLERARQTVAHLEAGLAHIEREIARLEAREGAV